MIFKGSPVDPVTKVPTTTLTVASDDVTPAVQFSSATASGAASATIDIALEKSWFGPAGGCDVTWSSSDGQSGTAHIKPNSNALTLEWDVPASAGDYTITLSDPERCVRGPATVCTVTVS